MLDVVGAFINAANPGISIEALDREIGQIAIAAKRLDRLRTDPFGGLRRDQLGHAGFHQAELAGIRKRRSMQHHLAGGLDARRHGGKAEADHLVFDDRLAKHGPLACIGQGRLIGRAADADGLGGDTNAAALEVRQRDAIALPFLAQAEARRDADVVEGDLACIGGPLARPNSTRTTV